MAVNGQSGSAILFLFVAVALLGALSYAFLQSSRGSTALISGEATKAATYQTQDCTNTVTMAVKRLQARGCPNISYNNDGSNSDGSMGDGSCSVFHPSGGGAKPCNSMAVLPPCTVTTIGSVCPNGSIYIGIYGGYRLYTTTADLPGTYTWNNGTANYTSVSTSPDGRANSNILVGLADAGAPYAAAQACRALGPEWFLPSYNEQSRLFQARNSGAMTGTVSSGTPYWSSMQSMIGVATAGIFDPSGGITFTNSPKQTAYKVRCMRRD